MRQLKLVLASAVAAGALSVSFAASAEDVKLGLLLAYTGPLEAMAPPIGEAAKLAAKQINDQGGILGGKLEMVVGDDTCTDATSASNTADRLINTDKVAAIVGGMCSGVTIAVANTVAIPAGVVMISPSATSPALTTLEDKDLVYRTAPSDAYQGDVMARMLMGKDIKDIAITYVNNDYGKGFADSLAAAFTAAGGKVAANVPHEEGKSDYRAELGTLAASGSPNLVILAYASGSGQTVLRQATESGDFTVYVGGDGMVGDALLTGIDASAVEGMIATKPGTPEIAGSGIFADAAKAAGLDPTAIFSPQAYDATFIEALAIQKKGNASRDGMAVAVREVSSAPGEVILPGEWEKAVKLLAEGKDINYEGASGAHEFDKAGDVPGAIVEMKVAGGKFEQVGPLN